MFGQQDDETPEVIAAEQAGSISAPSPKGGGSPLSQQHEGDGADSSGAVANAGDVGGGRQGGDAPDMLKDKGTVDQYLTQKIMNDKEGRYVTIMEESLNALKKLDPVDVRYAYDKSGMDGEGTLKETETLVNNAVDAGVTTGQMSEEEGEKRKFAFKNIFNVISREEMPLFLIDFGMRAMMAGETMGDLGALGAAGSGAMGALQGRRKEAYDRQVAEGQRRREDHKTSHDITMDRIEAEQKERELDIKEREKPPTLTETLNGFVYWDQTLNDGAGGWAEATVKGKKIEPPLSSVNRPFAPAALAEQLKQSGFFSDQDVAILAAKQPGRGQIKKDAMDAWERRMDDKTYPTNPATGRSFTSTEWKSVPDVEKEKYRSEYTERYVNEYLSVYEEVISDKDAAAAAQRALAAQPQ